VKESSWAVLQVDAYAQETAVFDKAALDDLGEEGNVDVASADHHDGATVTEVRF